MFYCLFRSEKFWFGCILAFVLFVSFYCFQTHPDFWFDEGVFYQVVKNWAFLNIRGVQLSPGEFVDLSMIAMGYPVLIPAVLAFQAFGSGVIILRLVAIAFLVGTVISFFFLSKRLYGSRVALLSVALFATFSPLYGNGKSFLGEVPGIFFFFLAAYFLAVLEQKIMEGKNNQPWRGVFASGASGIFFGFAVAVKPLFILILPALLVGILFRWRIFFGTTQGRRAILVGIGSLMIALLLWFLTQFGAESSAGRIFTHYANPYYLDEFLPTILRNLIRFFTESTPLLFLVQCIIGLYYVIRQIWKKQRIFAAEVVVYVFILLVTASYLRTIGWYRYFFPGHLAVFLFMVPGIYIFFNDVSHWLGRFHRRRPFFQVFQYPKRLVLTTVAIFLLVQIFPLSKNALSCTIDAPTLALSSIKNLNSTSPVLFYSVPQLAALYEGEAGYQFIRMSDAFQLGTGNVERLRDDFFDTVFIESKVARETDILPACFKLEQTVGPIDIYIRNTHIFCSD